MSRIVLTTIGSLGDLHPKLAIALELRRRGHEVVFATHKEYQSNIEALGFEFHRLRPDNTALSNPQEMARMMDLQKGTEYVIRQWVLPSLRDTYTDLMGWREGRRFDHCGRRGGGSADGRGEIGHSLGIDGFAAAGFLICA